MATKAAAPTALVAVSLDDEALKQRLILDEKRFNDLLRDVRKWMAPSEPAASSTPVPMAEEDEASAAATASVAPLPSQDELIEANLVLKESLLAGIATIQSTIAKSSLVVQMNTLQMAQLDATEARIQSEVEATRREISELKQTLELEKQLRANRQVYNKKASEVLKWESRTEAQNRIRRIEEEIQASQAEREKVEARIQLRQRQFSLLLHAAHQLQLVLYDQDSSPEQDLLDRMRQLQQAEDEENAAAAAAAEEAAAAAAALANGGDEPASSTGSGGIRRVREEDLDEDSARHAFKRPREATDTDAAGNFDQVEEDAETSANADIADEVVPNE
ncbi:hypothetical protein CAOG_01454 [Capsaspora owczarzaki ATCC 30864]|uniref:Uncharacterized protein n=1 Tax=Capsaspora owczarzaki (strain ATCC 30864) TaxID=595528 RepID=A0A0D2WKJ6_CAPO3|nr:hypothetical protein CAOG_01454 [Capsaspora owczarzaki ATCC 30864]KJE90103.1 hypothetical protein CAOG_001454 [Capsaspora owczarzaki ATCC 30864]|eukprot:XP_004364322.1 hypothetical protein CAOG_01454 [Capsaspora owczarzaki ATCC 30864]